MSKLVVVTGSTSGLGLAVAKAFAAKKYTIVLNSRELDSTAEQALAAIRGTSPMSTHVPADLAKPLGAEALAEAVSKVGQATFFVLVNNVGGAIDCPVLPFLSGKWLEQFNLNLFSAIRSIAALLPVVQSCAAASIINTSSIRALHHQQRSAMAAYGCAKAALNSITTSLARELAPKITVNAVLPGIIDSEYIRGLPPAQVDAWVSATPQRRLIPAEEIAQLYVSLAEIKAITGQLIVVDGGMSLGAP